MGVKTKISLESLNSTFKKYKFVSIYETTDGVMDTTYIAHTDNKSYIIKKYERDIKDKIEIDKELLQSLKSCDLNVPVCIDEKDGWYIYEKLSGKNPKNINTLHIQALARFLSLLHLCTYKKDFPHKFMQNYDTLKLLRFTKSNFYIYYKKLQSLKDYTMPIDGLIHGDIFKDNTVFDNNKIGVFDFIDSGSGSFLFDAGVTLVGFNVKKQNNYYINLFLKTYNQHAPKKLAKNDLKNIMDVSKKFYALLRINEYKNIKRAKELL